MLIANTIDWRQGDSNLELKGLMQWKLAKNQKPPKAQNFEYSGYLMWWRQCSVSSGWWMENHHGLLIPSCHLVGAIETKPYWLLGGCQKIWCRSLSKNRVLYFYYRFSPILLFLIAANTQYLLAKSWYRWLLITWWSRRYQTQIFAILTPGGFSCWLVVYKS